MKISILWMVISSLILSVACDVDIESNNSFQIRVETTTTVPLLAAERTYHYISNNLQPESLLINLRQAKIPVTLGILPLNNLCNDPIGPQFTVELSNPDDRILAYGFKKGEGRLACATRFRIYIIAD